MALRGTGTCTDIAESQGELRLLSAQPSDPSSEEASVGADRSLTPAGLTFNRKRAGLRPRAWLKFNDMDMLLLYLLLWYLSFLGNIVC